MFTHPQNPPEDLCSVCGEYGSCFCRICSARYCFDHLCLHLNVAHEDNSYTKRESKATDFNFGDNVDDIQDDELSATHSSADRLPDVQVSSSISNNAKPLTAYTETQLEAQHHFYITQARRIKRELERRSLPVAGFSFGEEGSLLSQRQQKLQSRNNSSAPVRTKPASKRAIEISRVLANAIGKYNITLEQIQEIVTKSSEPAAE